MLCSEQVQDSYDASLVKRTHVTYEDVAALLACTGHICSCDGLPAVLKEQQSRRGTGAQVRLV